MRSRRLTGWLLLVGMALAACQGSGPASPTPPGPTTSPTDAGSAGAAPTPSDPAPPEVWIPEWAGADLPPEVANRTPLPFCGVERPPQPQPGEFIDRATRLCFWNAHLTKSSAEFVSVQTTMEGDPIATIYRIENGRVTILTDFTQDRFGGGVWILTECASVVEGEGNALLGVADCGEGRNLE